MFEVDMNCENINALAQEFYDGELEKSKEAALFTHIANCENCRLSFISMSRIESAIRNDIVDFPYSMESKIYRLIKNAGKDEHMKISTSRHMDIFAYVLCALMIFISIFLYKTSNDYKKRFEKLTDEVKNQKIQIEMLMNSLPTVEITSTRIDTKVYQ